MFKPRDIFRKIGMEPDRFRFLVKSGMFTPDVHSTGQGVANEFSDKSALSICIFHILESTGFRVEQCQEITNRILASGFSCDSISVSASGQTWKGSSWEGPGGGIVSINAASVVTDAMLRMGITKEQMESWK